MGTIYSIDGMTIKKYAETHDTYDYYWYAKRCRREKRNTGRIEFTTQDVENWESEIEQFYNQFDGNKDSISPARIHDIRKGIMKRCFSKSCKDFKSYGGRGITVCDEWRGTYGVANFTVWAVLNGYNDGMTLDRINGDKDYSPDNCQWLPMKENIQKAVLAMAERRKK